MKIFIDNTPFELADPKATSFQDFCQKIMGNLLKKNRSIGSCEFDGVVINNVEEADALFPNCVLCKIESIPLSVALEAALTAKFLEAQALEGRCDELVTQALLAQPEEIAEYWYGICQEIKALIGFLPRLTGLLTEAQIDELIDKQLAEVTAIMQEISGSFNRGDILEISDIIELKLLPWMRAFRGFFHTCLQMTHRLRR